MGPGLCLSLCSPVTQWLWQEGGSQEVGGGGEGSSSTSFQPRACPGFIVGRRQPTASRPSGELSPQPWALMLGSDQTAEGCSQDFGW